MSPRSFPQESLITVTGASATALVYFGDHEDSLKGKVILIPEAAAIAGHSNGDENPAAVLVRSLLSEGHIDRIVTITQRDGEPRAVRVRRNGPVAVLMTSARENVDPEMLTRLDGLRRRRELRADESGDPAELEPATAAT